MANNHHTIEQSPKIYKTESDIFIFQPLNWELINQAKEILH